MVPASFGKRCPFRAIFIKPCEAELGKLKHTVDAEKIRKTSEVKSEKKSSFAGSSAVLGVSVDVQRSGADSSDVKKNSDEPRQEALPSIAETSKSSQGELKKFKRAAEVESKMETPLTVPESSVILVSGIGKYAKAEGLGSLRDGSCNFGNKKNGYE